MGLLFITGNSGKFQEIKKLLPSVEQLDIDLSEIQHLDSQTVLKAKLLEAQNHTSDPFIVEDTSFTLTGMGGLPGPLSKWFLKSIGNAGIVKLSKTFGAEAVAKSIIGFSDENKNISFYEGVLKGEIVEDKGQVSAGFGWDPIFKPNGHNKTLGEMSQDEKNLISMRKIAVEKFIAAN
ncbi:non-canonical purine NTP pyrophosphatase [bacterium]|nr:non-canonical purine NTP pyrophosphatase [bacterium]